MDSEIVSYNYYFFLYFIFRKILMQILAYILYQKHLTNYIAFECNIFVSSFKCKLKMHFYYSLPFYYPYIWYQKKKKIKNNFHAGLYL